ncbi:MAG TPA: SPOR domain-containing protein, partial [Archangium sp.]
MRDSHRLKEKYELSLDNRQIVSITIASLVVLGGVFMLGVVVGKKLSGETAALAQQQQPADLLSQLDKQTEALETVKADAALTFQDELTRKAPTPVADVPAPKPVEAVKPPEPKVAEAPKPEPVAVAEAPKPAPVAEEPKP